MTLLRTATSVTPNVIRLVVEDGIKNIGGYSVVKFTVQGTKFSISIYRTNTPRSKFVL